MKKFALFGIFAVFSMILTMVPEMAFATAAADVGQDLMGDIADQIQGSLGTIVGLGIALIGLYMWLVQQSSWGIMMIIGGVGITAFPGFFDSMQENFVNVFADTGASTATKGSQVAR